MRRAKGRGKGREKEKRKWRKSKKSPKSGFTSNIQEYTKNKLYTANL